MVVFCVEGLLDDWGGCGIRITETTLCYVVALSGLELKPGSWTLVRFEVLDDPLASSTHNEARLQCFRTSALAVLAHVTDDSHNTSI